MRNVPITLQRTARSDVSDADKGYICLGRETGDGLVQIVVTPADIGVQFVGIPEFQAIGTEVEQNISAVLASKMSVEQALKASQNQAERAMKQGGYVK